MRRNFLLGFVLGAVAVAAVGGLGLATAATPSTSGPGAAGVVTYVEATRSADWVNGQAYYLGTSPNVGSGYFTRSVDLATPAVTATVLRTGSVEIFVKTDPDINGANWTALPFTFPHAGSAWSYVFAAETFVGKVRVNFFFAGDLASAPPLSTYRMPDYTIKVVVVPHG